MTALEKLNWEAVCDLNDLVADSGICVLVGRKQIALFYLPDAQPPVYALGNGDPIGGANVMSRGIVGDLGGRLVVASPLYKQHFDLTTGQCLEEDAVCIDTFEVRIQDDKVLIRA